MNRRELLEAFIKLGHYIEADMLTTLNVEWDTGWHFDNGIFRRIVRFREKPEDVELDRMLSSAPGVTRSYTSSQLTYNLRSEE